MTCVVSSTSSTSDALTTAHSHKRSLGRDEELDTVRDLLGRAPPRHRADLVRDLRAALGDDALHHRSANSSGVHRVDSNQFLWPCVLLCDTRVERLDCTLTCLGSVGPQLHSAAKHDHLCTAVYRNINLRSRHIVRTDCDDRVSRLRWCTLLLEDADRLCHHFDVTNEIHRY
mgnify:FL=1